jgi:hypothetical protein
MFLCFNSLTVIIVVRMGILMRVGYILKAGGAVNGSLQCVLLWKSNRHIEHFLRNEGQLTAVRRASSYRILLHNSKQVS